MTELVLHAPLAGWVMPLDQVPDPVFAGAMLGEGLAIDPVGRVLHAPCDATVETIHAASHAVTLRADAGLTILLHLGIDTVALGGVGFEPLVAPGDRVSAGTPLIGFDLDALVRKARAMVTPMIVTDSERAAISILARDRLVAVGEPLLRVVLHAPSPAAAKADDAATGAVRRTVRVGLAHGLHARPAARIVAAVRALDATLVLRHGDREASAASAVAMLGLGLSHDTLIDVEARGADAPAAIDAVEGLLANEPDEAPPPLPAPAIMRASLADGALTAVPAAPGLAIGPAHWLVSDTLAIPSGSEGAERETAKLEEGLAQVIDTLDAAATTPGALGGIIAAHLTLVDDPDLRARALAAIADGANAAAAWMIATGAHAALLRASADRRIAERADDLVDIGHRVARAILGDDATAAPIPAGSILLARDLLPSQLVALDGALPAGLCIAGGGPTSHVAILAAGMGLPMIVAVGEPLATVRDGQTLLLDADAGTLRVDPDQVLVAAATRRIEVRRAAEATARAAGGQPTRTTCGTRIGVYANLGSVADARAAVAQGAEGCGLLRTEFLFLDRDTAPTAAEQAADYQAIADTLGDRPLVIRLLDIGGDKPAPYIAIPAEENPALGLRGVRVALARPELLDTQLRAILSVVPGTPCRIMVPMVSGVDELRTVRAALDRIAAEHGGVVPELGVMIETPAAALCADIIAEQADFLSIGSNDLTQYALAMDRGNPAVAGGVDGLHPAVLRLIAAACEGGAARNRPVGVCGGLAADGLAVPILLGLGVRTLSVPPVRIPAIKALVSTLSIDACRGHAREALACPTAQAVRALAGAFAEETRR